MGALRLDLLGSKSAQPLQPYNVREELRHLDAPREENSPWLWTLAVVATLIASVLLLWWTPATPPIPLPVLP